MNDNKSVKQKIIKLFNKLRAIQSVLNSQGNKTLLLVFKILVTAALLYYIFTYVDTSKIVLLISTSNKYFFLTAFSLVFLLLYFQYLKWKKISSLLLNENRSKLIVNSLFYGFTAGAFTPARIGEYAGRALVFKDRKVIDVAIAVMLDKAITYIVLVSTGLVSAFIFILYKELIPTYALVLIIVVVVSISVTWFLTFRNYKPKWLRKLYSKFSIKYESLIKLKDLYRNDKKSFYTLFIITYSFYLIILIQFSLLLNAFHGSSTFISGIWIASLVYLGKTLIPSITIGEIGIRETVSMFIVVQFGLVPELGFNAAFILFVINIVFPALAGVGFMLRDKQ